MIRLFLRRLNVILICLFMITFSFKFCVYGECNTLYISENNYSQNMNEKVVPFLKSVQTEGIIPGKNNVNLYYRAYMIKDAKASIVISHGFSEYLERYEEIIYYFLQNKYNVFILEHRGHGRSGTLGKIDKTQISVENFDYYVEDLKCFVDKIVMPVNKDKKIFLFAHSMGGAIGAKLLENYSIFDGAVLSAPMIEVDTGLTPAFVAKIITNIKKAVGCGNEYVLGHGKYRTNYSIGDSGTSSRERFNYYNKILIENKELQRGGPDYNWLYESFKVTSEVTKKENAEKIKVPVLLFQAENDTYVNSGGQNKLVKYNSNCKLIKVNNSKHEIYRECDKIQKPYIEKIIAFYNDNL